MNYSVKDTLGILTAAVALAPVLFAPGYTLGWTLNLFELRQRRPVLRLIAGVPLTIAITPIIVYLLARFAPAAVCVFYGVSALVCAWVLARDFRNWSYRRLSRFIWIGLAIAAAWVVVAIGSLIDLQLGTRLYVPVEAYDHSLRVAILGAISRHMPPTNPSFGNTSAPLRYHYLWILLISVPLKIVNLPLRDLTYAGVVWCGMGFLSLVAFALKFLAGVRTRIEQKVILAFSLLCVTGLDLLPTLYMAAADKTWQADMEWWNDVQISSWAASLLWVPHNIAALIACVVGFVLLRRAGEEGTGPAMAVVSAGICFASATGLSIYVTFTFVVVVALWMLALGAQKHWKEVLMFAGSGAVAVIVALPFLKSLSGPGEGAAFVAFALRPFPLGVHLAAKLGFAMRSAGSVAAVDLIGLPLNYLLELGLFLAIAGLRFRDVSWGFVRATRDEIACWMMVAASFLVGTFLRSATIDTNDLGTRCFLAAQLVLLLWAAIYFDEWFFSRVRSIARWTKVALAVLLVIGISSTVYEVFMLRFFPVLKDRGKIAGVLLLDGAPDAGRRTYSLRSLYEQLNLQLPGGAVFQSNPTEQNGIVHTIYSGHDAVAGDSSCGLVFGGSKELCLERLGRLYLLYNDPNDVPSGACSDYGIDVLIVQDTDPVWQEPQSWVWREQPIASNEYARAFWCGNDRPTARSAVR